MGKSNHIHKLKRHKFKTGNAVFFCIGDNCYFKIASSLALGKANVCWRCGKEFKLDEYSIRLSKPHCKDCHKSKKEVEIVEVDNELRKRMDEVFKKLDESTEVDI